MISIYVGPVEVRWAIGPKFFLGIKIFRVPVVPPRGAPARPVMFSPPPPSRFPRGNLPHPHKIHLI
jgi:hypothetical protein